MELLIWKYVINVKFGRLFIVLTKEKQLTQFVSDFLEKAPFLADVFPFGAKVVGKWIGC